MLRDDLTIAPLELKFAGDGATGEFSGYASVFGVQDAHGDVILPGAFADSLAERKAKGRGLPMHLNHGIAELGGRRGVGVWKNVAEDSRGLQVEGKISGMNTDAGRLLYEQVKDGAFPGLSIGYRVKKNGSSLGTKAGEPRRTIKAVDLGEASLVDDPSNAAALVTEIKSRWRVKTALATPDADKAATSLAAAMRLHDKVMGGSEYSYSSPKDKALLMDHLRDAHQALTGQRAPDGLDGWTKGMPSPDEVKAALVASGMTDEQAEQFAALGFKSAPPPSSSPASLFASFGGFTLPTL